MKAKEDILLLICIISCFLCSIYFIFWIYVAKKHQEKAYAGDRNSAKRIILPFYQPLKKMFAVAFGILGLSLSLMFLNDSIPIHRIFEFYGFLLVVLYLVIPCFLLQTSASLKALWRTLNRVVPWFLSTSILWGLSFLQFPTGFSFRILFYISGIAFPIFVSIGILTKLLSSRVQIGSLSNRNSTELLLLYSILYGLTMFLSVMSPLVFGLDIFFAIFSFMTNQLFPFAIYRTLIADTKFWRGLGKHNQGGMNLDDDLRSSGIDVHRPTMDLSIVASSFQSMMADINDITVDFAYLQLERLIGEGATSKVFRGKLKGKLVAIKLSTPPEITEEVIDIFVAEAKVASSLRHRNIVQFLGICVRPPQIGMVFEFCEGGNLKSSLTKNASRWKTFSARVQGCLDAANAINCLHQNGYIHRDIKAENFFVGKKWVVKLGDFGEATKTRNMESTKAKRMTILGTVAFMAPELVSAERHYTQSIDIYALGVTFWEIWTQMDPYDGCSTFEIYEKVKNGEKLKLTDDMPNLFREILLSMWDQEPQNRPTGEKLITMLTELIDQNKQQQPEDIASSPPSEVDISSVKNPILSANHVNNDEPHSAIELQVKGNEIVNGES